MRKYRASNQVPFRGMLLLLMIALVSGVVLGMVLWAFETQVHFYMLLTFPLFAGAIAGALLRYGVRVGKVRSPLFAVLMGIVAALVMFSVFHAAEYYVTFRGILSEPTVETGGKPPSDADVETLMQEVFHDQHVTASGLLGYLEYEARIGFSVTNADFTSRDPEFNLTGNLVYGYWLLEIVIAAFVAAFIAQREANQPFDEEADDWYGKPTLLATAPKKSRKALVNALKNGDFQTAGSLLTPDPLTTDTLMGMSSRLKQFPRAEVLIRRAASASGSLPQQDIYLTVNYAQRQGRSMIQRRGVVSPSELDLLQRAMSTQPASSARFPL